MFAPLVAQYLIPTAIYECAEVHPRIQMPKLWERSAMLGWHISVYRQKDGGASPGTALTPKGTRLAVWQTGLWGLDWLDELVKAGKAINLGENSGYPCRYTATAECLIPRIIDTPPRARARWALGPEDIVNEKWEGKTVVDRDGLAGCPAKEWLLVEAWDES
jgi:hypothetical protein